MVVLFTEQGKAGRGAVFAKPRILETPSTQLLLEREVRARDVL